MQVSDLDLSQIDHEPALAQQDQCPRPDLDRFEIDRGLTRGLVEAFDQNHSILDSPPDGISTQAT